jgi:hypothetical protein
MHKTRIVFGYKTLDCSGKQIFYMKVVQAVILMMSSHKKITNFHCSGPKMSPVHMDDIIIYKNSEGQKKEEKKLFFFVENNLLNHFIHFQLQNNAQYALKLHLTLGKSFLFL